MSGVVRRRAPLAFADRRLQMARQLIIAALDELSGAVPAGLVRSVNSALVRVDVAREHIRRRRGRGWT